MPEDIREVYLVTWLCEKCNQVIRSQYYTEAVPPRELQGNYLASATASRFCPICKQATNQRIEAGMQTVKLNQFERVVKITKVAHADP